MKAFWIFLSSAVWALNASGQSLVDSSLCSGGYSVYYLNGVYNEPAEVYDNARNVQEMLGNSFDGEPLTVSASVNPSSIVGDAVEVFAQKLAEDPTLKWQLFFRWFSGEFITSSLTIALDDFIGTAVTQKFAQAVSSLSSPQAYSDAVVVSHAQTYAAQLTSGRRVMAVAHSQGNLYANAIYGRLQSVNSGRYNLSAFGIAGAASPANFVATGDGYVTSDGDHVIDALRILAPAVLPSNDSSVPTFTTADVLGHNFKNIYINPQFNIRGHVNEVMLTTLGRISTQILTSASGPITATLTWSSPGDVDLHSFEPDFHVYYGARQGSIGFLDKDDTSGTGPEHYYASCQSFAPGSYAFGANYYSGIGSKQATIKLSVLGVDYPARTVLLSAPLGSSGNNSPVILWRVLVEQDQQGSFTAKIQ